MKTHKQYITVFKALVPALALFFVSCGGGGITIAKNGKSPYAIVLSSKASLSEKHAAGELRNLIRMATDADVPIVNENDPRAGTAPRIFVGAGPAFEALNTGGGTNFSKRFRDQNVKPRTYDISSSDFPSGEHVWGVSFLDALVSLGIRGITFPRRKSTGSSVDIRGKTAFIIRENGKGGHGPPWAPELERP